jgi:hypothetical protein
LTGKAQNVCQLTTNLDPETGCLLVEVHALYQAADEVSRLPFLVCLQSGGELIQSAAVNVCQKRSKKLFLLSRAVSTMPTVKPK